MTNYTNLDHKEMKELIREFDVGNMLDLGLMEGGQANSNFTLETDKRKFVISVLEELSFEEAKNLSELLYYLEHKGFFTSRIVQSKVGGLVTKYKNKPVIMKEYIEGQVCKELGQNMLIQIGEEAAKLHRIPAPPFIKNLHLYCIDFFHEIASPYSENKYALWLEEKRKFIKGLLKSPLSIKLIHGDIFWDNILFDKGNLVAIIDFEEACKYYKLFDIGRSIIGTCVEDGKVSIDKARCLIKGYQNEGQISEKEKQLLQPFAEYGAVAASFWRYRQYNMRNPLPEKAEFYREMVDVADYLHSIKKKEFIKALF